MSAFAHELFECVWPFSGVGAKRNKMVKDYYSKIFLEECKYVIKQNEMSKFINKDLEISSDESDDLNDCDDSDDEV